MGKFDDLTDEKLIAAINIIANHQLKNYRQLPGCAAVNDQEYLKNRREGLAVQAIENPENIYTKLAQIQSQQAESLGATFKKKDSKEEPNNKSYKMRQILGTA